MAMCSMLHVATSAGEDEAFDTHQPKSVKSNLRKAVKILCEENNPKDLESYAT